MNNKKKLIVLFTTTHADTLGNACRLEIVDFLSRYFKTIIVTNRKDFIAGRFSNCNIVGYQNPKGKPLPILADIFEWRRVAKIINNADSDLCFMFDDTSAISNFLKIPVFQYVHQFGSRLAIKPSLVKRIYRTLKEFVFDKFYLAGLKKSKAIFVVSKPIIDILKAKGIENLIHTPHGIELQKFSNPEINDFHFPLKKLKEDGYFIITYTGWVTENRGFQLMLDSIKAITQHYNKALLVIAGADEEYSKRISDFQEKNQLQNNIINFGVIDVSLIPGILYYSDVCFSFLDDVPAYRISPPQKVVEYYAAGKPVICNKIETHEWLVEHRKTGFVLNMDAAEVAHAVIELINNKALYQRMADNAAKEARKFDIKLIYGNMVNTMRTKLDEC